MSDFDKNITFFHPNYVDNISEVILNVWGAEFKQSGPNFQSNWVLKIIDPV